MHSRIIAVFIFMVLPVAVSSCDPLTQYNEEGQCCKKCGPGTRMDSASSNCQDPLCKPCKDDEYQAGYTTEIKCELHDYCDINKNKESVNRSKTSKGSCRCKTGYHCASDDCITCDADTICNPGHRIQSRGNHIHDTVCQKCPPDTFSNGTSEKCSCAPGHRLQTQGSASSDTICVKDSTEQQHVYWIVPLICIPALLIVIGIIIYKTSAKAKVKGCVESCCHKAEKEPVRANPTVELMTEEREPQQEEQDTKTPEENLEDNEELSQSLISNEVAKTENGNMVVQEDGKSELLSRQESQTQESMTSY